MFNDFSPPIDDILNLLAVLVAVVVGFAYTWTQIKRGKSDADSSTIKTYQDEVTALKLSNERIIQESKAKDLRIDELMAKLNQALGEIKSLKELNALRDPQFMSTLKGVLDEIKKMRENFEEHVKQDDYSFGEIHKNFGEISDKIDRNFKAYIKT